MRARMVNRMQAAADFLGPGAIETNKYQSEIFDLVKRRGVFGQRIHQQPDNRPATSSRRLSHRPERLTLE